MSHLIVSPAYGRTYSSAEEAETAWATGKDFVVTDPHSEKGRYVNRADAVAEGIIKVTIFYGRGLSTVIKTPSDEKLRDLQRVLSSYGESTVNFGEVDVKDWKLPKYPPDDDGEGDRKYWERVQEFAKALRTEAKSHGMAVAVTFGEKGWFRVTLLGS